jgi:hypothetical protein
VSDATVNDKTVNDATELRLRAVRTALLAVAGAGRGETLSLSVEHLGLDQSV